MTSGVLFVATGQKYLNEVVTNLRLTQQFYENVSIALYTDSFVSEADAQLFNVIKYVSSPCHGYRDKISSLLDLPYDCTLFLDTDVKPAFPIASSFEILKHYDLAGCHAPVRLPPGWVDQNVPLYFPEINTGVIYLHRSQLTIDLIGSWLSLYDYLRATYSQNWDQASFRSSLWKFCTNNQLKFLLLPSEFNLRTTKPWIVGRGLSTYFVHGRFDINEWSSFVQYLNSDVDRFRTFSEWSTINPTSTIRPRFDRTFN